MRKVYEKYRMPTPKELENLWLDFHRYFPNFEDFVQAFQKHTICSSDGLGLKIKYLDRLEVTDYYRCVQAIKSRHEIPYTLLVEHKRTLVATSPAALEAHIMLGFDPQILVVQAPQTNILKLCRQRVPSFTVPTFATPITFMSSNQPVSIQEAG